MIVPATNIPKKYLDRKVDEYGFKIKYKDVFDLDEFYKAVYYWAKEYGWASDKKGNIDGEQFEVLYREIRDPSGVKHYDMHWRLSKKAADTNQLQYHLDINMQIIALVKTEVIKDGKKIKAHKGEIEIEVKPFIEKKFEEDIDKAEGFKGFILKTFKPLITNRIYRTILGQRRKELYREVYIFQNFLKQWFRIKRYLPYEDVKSWSPSKAWPSDIK